MEYRKFDNIIIARIDKGEEILEQLKAIAITENIKLASINALGAINDFTVGVYKTDEKKYYSNSFKGYYEITSLTGTINTMDGEYYAHLHLIPLFDVSPDNKSSVIFIQFIKMVSNLLPVCLDCKICLS